ncbi:TcpD family membrane protein [Leuconostoc pseudomesenteroides]|uniref:TcpD family membrane protein n=1 Tax=Leuconostoc pseudomesenteroides TaxID=33968 RepID=UPI0032E00771
MEIYNSFKPGLLLIGIVITVVVFIGYGIARDNKKMFITVLVGGAINFFVGAPDRVVQSFSGFGDLFLRFIQFFTGGG